MEKFSLADFSLHAGSNPLALAGFAQFPCRAWSDVKNRAGTRTRARITPQRQFGETTCGRQRPQDGSRGASRRLRERSERPPDGSTSIPRGSKRAPRGLQTASRALQGVSGRLQEHFKRVSDASGGLETSPRALQEALQMGTDKKSQEKLRQYKIRQDTTRQDEIRQDDTRYDWTRRSKPRQDKTRRNKIPRGSRRFPKAV